ncbi:MAG: hypothetical protein M3475_06730 [Actinomycetota bacterium]|nr:hypothetical protein [Actinomycetota bacterium]
MTRVRVDDGPVGQATRRYRRGNNETKGPTTRSMPGFGGSANGLIPGFGGNPTRL